MSYKLKLSFNYIKLRTLLQEKDMSGMTLDVEEVKGVIKDIALAIPLESLAEHKQDYIDGLDFDEIIGNIIDENKHYSDSQVRYEVDEDVYEYQGHGVYTFKKVDYSMEYQSLYDYVIENNKEYFISILKDRFMEIA